MYLTDQQRRLYFEKIKKLNNPKINRGGLSSYSTRLLNGLYEANEELGEECYDDEVCSRKQFENELEKISLVIKKHPILKRQFEYIKGYLEHDIFPLEDEQGYEILMQLIRLQAALGIKINTDFCYSIDTSFDEVYMDVVNNHFIDEFKVAKTLKK